MLSSSTGEVITEAEKILRPCNAENWRAPGDAEIIIDLKCPIFLESFVIKNAVGNVGTKQFSLSGSRDLAGPWAELYSGTVARGDQITPEVSVLSPYYLHNIAMQDIDCCKRRHGGTTTESSTIPAGSTTTQHSGDITTVWEHKYFPNINIIPRDAEILIIALVSVTMLVNRTEPSGLSSSKLKHSMGNGEAFAIFPSLDL